MIQADDTTAPLVTVLTVALNARAALVRTVASVAGQGFTGREHVVVDGGSTDGTADWLARLETPVRWISEADSGIAEALNKGLALARGDYVLVLQAGDTFLDAGSLGRAVPWLDGSDIVSFDVRIIGARGPRRYRSRGFVPKLNVKTTIPHQGAFCRRALFDRIGGFDESLRIAMDFDFFLRAMRRGAAIRLVPDILARMPDDGISSRKDWPSLKKRFAEERRVHRLHCPGPTMRAVYAVLWPPYLAWRRVRAALVRA
jgi:glycosyltransferase involved in cell wall biosynthesis